MKAILKLTAINYLLSAVCLSVQAQGTAFTYQGRLNDGGAPAHGNYDFRFKLFEDSFGNNQAGGTVLTNGISVTNGLFMVTMDFGAGIFNGSNYWLEVDVRTNGVGGYADLNPLQAVTPTPYAIFAITASNLSGTLSAAQLSGTYGNAVTLNNSGNNFSGSFNGNGANVTNVNGSQITSGTIADARLSANIARLNANQTFTGTNTFVGAIVFNGLNLQPNAGSNGSVNVIEGSSGNYVSNGIIGATIGGGGATNYLGVAYTNKVTAVFGTVSGGLGNTASGTAATVGGGELNTASLDSTTVGGGFNNAATNGSTTVAGGFDNLAGGNVATVGGGGRNVANGDYSTVAGGRLNFATNSFATVSGGYGNVASGYGATVAGGGNDGNTTAGNIASGAASFTGGIGNTASGYAATALGDNSTASGSSSVAIGGAVTAGGDGSVALGEANSASGAISVAMGFATTASGFNSTALGYDSTTTNNASFVWSDHSADYGATSVSDNSVTFRAGGGYRFFTALGAAGAQLLPNATSWTTLSDRNAKKNFQAVDTEAVLAKLAAIPVQQWNYKWEKDGDVPNIGPMAQDFKHATDMKAQQAENAELKQRLEALEKIIRNQKTN